MRLQVSSLIKVEWIDADAVDSSGSAWMKVFDFDELPELVTVPLDMGSLSVREWIEGRYGFRVGSWSYWSAVREATAMADNLYSSDPV